MESVSACLRRDGRRWRGVVTITDESGRHQRTKSFPDARTKTQALRALAEFRGEVESERPEVSLQGYAEEYVASLRVEESTRSNYSYTLLYIRELGDVPLNLSPSAAQRWEDGLLARGLSPSTAGKAHRLLKQVLSQAVEDGLIDSNPMDRVKPPRRVQGNPNALDSKGRARLLSLLADMDRTPLCIAAYIALCTGMRRGEICALRWSDVDLAAHEIRVRRSVGMGKGGAYEKEPKTPSSRRTIPIPPILSDVLGSLERTGLYVLGGDSFHSPPILGKEWAAFARSFKLVGTEGRICTFHDLRHTYATMAIAGGADVKSVSSIMGHANAAITLNVYASADDDAKRRAAEIVGRSLG